jgi:predicted dehydrogenase
MPTLLQVEGGKAPSPEAWRSEQVVSYAESFKEELMHFHDCVTGGLTPVTSGEDALGDIALCEAIIHAHLGRTPVEKPTDAPASRSRLESRA